MALPEWACGLAGVYLRAKLRGRIEVVGECWRWCGYTDRDGRGRMEIGGASYTAQRVIYEAWIGPLPRDTVPAATCATRLCCRPAHLRAMTHAEAVLTASLRRRGVL